MTSPLEFSVIVPVYNEAETIGTLIGELLDVLEGRAYEIIIVDDGSTDSTRAQLADLKARTESLRVISHAVNAGQSRAIRTGAEAARGRILGTLDGDGQNDPADLPELYRLLTSTGREHGVDCVPGLVIGERQNRKDTAWKMFGSAIGNRVRQFLLKDDCKDSGCGIKVIPRAVFLALPYFDHMHRYMPALIRAEGLDYISHPVRHRPRTGGRSKYDNMGRAWSGLRDMRGVLWLTQRRSKVQNVREL